MTLVEAEKLAVKVLKQVMEETINSTNTQLASITKDGFQIYSEAQVQQILSQ